MKLLGTDLLDKFTCKHADSRKALESWAADVKRSEWKTPQDIKNRYRSVDFLSDNRVIFNIRGNNYRLVVKVRYQNGIVRVIWVGTHAEYDKQSF